MKTLFLALVVLLTPLPIFAQETWTIDAFQSDIHIQENGTVIVSEVLSVDFKDNQKHGIIRTIPYVYEDEQGNRTYTRIEDITVNQDGEPAEINTTRDDQYLHIRIGDPKVTINHKHVYEIRYVATGVLQSFETFDEFAWNVTGNGWEVPITSAQATIHVPTTISQTSCYEGAYGSSAQCATNTKQSNTASFSSKNLQQGEGLTIAVGFKKGIVPILKVPKPPSLGDVLLSRITWVTFLVISALGIGILIRHGYRYGRDRYSQRSHLPDIQSEKEDYNNADKILPLLHRLPVVAEYASPDNLRPAEIGVLLDERADTLDISATIVDLACRGFLEITEVPKKWIFGKTDYTFTRTDKTTEGLMKYESLLLDRLFDGASKVTMSDLTTSFYTDLQNVKQSLYAEVVTKKLFPKNPHTVRTLYIGIGIGLMLSSFAVFFALIIILKQSQTITTYHQLIGGLGAALIPCGIATCIASFYMPRKTALGRTLYARALGYKLFISTTEKHRAKFFENEGLFWEILPYAIVFGVTDKLAKALQRMDIKPPSPTWYHGSGQFQAALFLSHMDSFSSSIGTAMASTPKSSGSMSGGGGFSGGGFGGGGGGSW